MRCTAFVAGIFFAVQASFLFAAQATGTISGSVITAAGTPRPLRVTIDHRVCGNEVADESIVRDASGNLANAVVVVTGVTASSGPSEPTVLNERCRFVPRVQVGRPR